MTLAFPRWPVLGLLCGALLAAGCAAEAATHRNPKKKHHRATPVRSDHAPEPVTYGRRDDVMALAADIAERQSLPRDWVEAQLAQARLQPSVQRLIAPPVAGTAKNWAAYRARFVEPQRIQAGLQFWQANNQWLQKAEAQYGVPAAVVVGIVGVETYYGRILGNFRVLDALATLAFDFPPGRRDRSPFFRDELAQFLVLCRRQSVPCGEVKGSYAGAMGLPQFMPSSFNRDAVDFDGDGRIDLYASPADVIGSVAHFLAAAGWQRGQPTHYDVAPPVEVSERAALLAPDVLPSFTATQMAEHGAVLGAGGRAHAGLLALVELQNGEAAPSYLAGTQNFYAVTRYNQSSYYALAVLELGAAIAREAAPPDAAASAPR
jgi:membrane-bound lytic murein transglycosylase B